MVLPPFQQTRLHQGRLFMHLTCFNELDLNLQPQVRGESMPNLVTTWPLRLDGEYVKATLGELMEVTSVIL